MRTDRHNRSRPLLAAVVAAATLLAWPLAPTRAQTVGDSDGDGVADAADCNPADPRVASPHTYYFDRDGDMSGNAFDPATLCSATPFAGTSLWHGDPDDADPIRRGIVVPRGERRLGVDFADTPADGVWRPELVRELGADVTPLHVVWNQIETAPGQYNGPQVALLDALAVAYRQQGLSVSLTISPISQIYLTVPADIAAGMQAGSLSLGSPAVIARFNALIAFVHARLTGIPVIALQIGHEIDRYLEVRSDAAFWTQFAALFTAARAQAQANWGAGLTVGMTATAQGLVTFPASALMSSLNAQADHVSATYAPRSTGFEAISADRVRADVQGVIAAAYPRRVMFQAVAAPSAVRTLSSTTAQAQFYEAFFAVWDEYASLVPFVSVGRLFDWSAARAAGEAAAPHVSAGAALGNAAAFLQTLGLREYAGGTAKAAYDTVRMLALERGWWRNPPNTTRRTMVGFTPALYDREGTGIDNTVLANVMQRIGEAADLVLFQFDNGVPWTEALTDTLSGPLPYSANLRETWTKYRAARPPGTRVAVAINAIGVPRSRLAPYWGVGEDFYLDANMQQVGTGVIRDFENRLLPPEWRTRTWDDPAVKTAFTNYAKRAIQFFSPDYLIIGIEANLALEPDPAAFTRFVSLQRYVYEALKADPATAHVPVMVSFVGEHLLVDRLGQHYLIDGTADALGLQRQHLDALAASAPYLDMVGVSSYPLKTRFGTSRPPAAMFDHLMSAIRSVTDKPVAITETGYPSRAFSVKNQQFQGSPEKQAQYYRLLFAEAEEHTFEFVASYTPFDLTPFMDRLREGAARIPPDVSPELVEFFKYFEFLGLFELGTGTPRPAGEFLLQYVSLPLIREQTWIAPVQITSPDGALTATIGVAPDGRLYYAVDSNGRQRLDASPLGQIVDGANLGAQVTNIELGPSSIVDNSYPTRGVHPIARDHHVEATLTVRRAPLVDRTVRIQFRVFDDGVAYRYEVPGAGTRTIGGEVSAWTLPEGSRVWHQVSTENYEANYRGTTLGYFNDDIGGPITAELPGGGYVLLSEAALLGYAGMTYDADLGSRTLKGEFLDTGSWPTAAGTMSPWRVMLAADSLDQLVNSDVIGSLNAPPDPSLFPAGARTWWIKPGRAVWSWWSDSSSGFSYDTQRQYVDLAHQLRAEYQVIDAGWETGFPVAGADAFQQLSALSAYSHVQWRDVGLWVWKYWYELADPVARKTFFARVAAAGAVGVKVDNVYGYQSESFDNVALQEAVLRDAAAERLMINFHGVGKSTGLQRTYPNEITREGFMGLELNGLAWDRGLFVAPEHNAAVPFVRLVAGPGDYTPVTLDPRKIGATTFAHQLATAGIFTSPLQHWADNPNVLLQQPAAVDLLRTLPVEWDETRVLPPSEIGRLAIFARRAAGRWYLFAINGDAVNARSLSVPADFLGAGRWAATTIRDAAPTSLTGQTLANLTSASIIDVPMLPGGGFVAVFAPEPDLSAPVLQGFSSLAPAFTNEGWQRGYSMLRDHAGIVSQSLQEGVPWPEALVSSDSATYSAHLRGYWSLLKTAHDAVIPGHPVYLMLNPVETASYAKLAPYLGERDYMPLPAPWDGYEFNHPDVKQAFTNYAIAAIEYFHPAYVAIGVEANILLAKRPDRWNAYKELNAHVYRALKARYPSLTVFATVQYEYMLGLFKDAEQLAEQVRVSYPGVLEAEVGSLLRDSDLLAISTYPFMVENNILIGPSTRLDRDYYDRAFALGRLWGKRVAFEQSGYITRDLYADASNVTLPGSEERQRAFVAHVLRDAYVQRPEFVINFVGIDYGTNYGTSPVMATWAYTGFRREDGTDKPALAVWDAFRAGAGAGALTSMTASVPSSSTDTPALTSSAQLGALIAEGARTGALAWPGTDAPPSPELFVRWQQFASLLPTFVPPPIDDPTTPWGFGEPYFSAARATLLRRQALLAYLQPLFDEFSRTGVSPLRALPGQGTPAYLVGEWLLAAPVIEEGAATRELTLPAGTWVDWHTGEAYEGAQTIVVSAPLDRLPLFVRRSATP